MEWGVGGPKITCGKGGHTEVQQMSVKAGLCLCMCARVRLQQAYIRGGAEKREGGSESERERDRERGR